jgi:molecular chaperone HscB
MNYFEFFNLEPSFYLDENLLRKAFLQNSKMYHPDFFTLESKEKQAEILERSTFNNEAYKTLKDFDKRLYYILDLNNIIEEEGKNTVPQDFLMEMMEVNEALMELEFDFDPIKKEKLENQLDALEQNLLNSIESNLKGYTSTTKSENLNPVKDYYFKKKYLIRLRENLQKMG